jgi:hypothetical protein
MGMYAQAKPQRAEWKMRRPRSLRHIGAHGIPTITTSRPHVQSHVAKLERPMPVCTSSTYDIIGAGGLPRINSIMMPATRTAAPVVGVALITETAVPGVATGANQAADLEAAARFCLEVAKAFGRNACAFYDPEHFAAFTRLYGRLSFLQGSGPMVDSRQ